MEIPTQIIRTYNIINLNSLFGVDICIVLENIDRMNSEAKNFELCFSFFFYIKLIEFQILSHDFLDFNV